MNEAPYETQAHDAIRSSMLLSDAERAAIQVAEMRVVDVMHLTSLLTQADAAILTIQKARALVEELVGTPER